MKKFKVAIIVAGLVAGAFFLIPSKSTAAAKKECLFSQTYCCSTGGVTYCGVCEGCEVN